MRFKMEGVTYTLDTDGERWMWHWEDRGGFGLLSNPFAALYDLQFVTEEFLDWVPEQ